LQMGQINIIKRLSLSKIRICLDNDHAGIKGTDDAIDLLVRHKIPVEIIDYEGKDPEDAIIKGAFDVSKTLDILGHYYKLYSGDATKMVNILTKEPSIEKRKYWTEKIAYDLGIPPKALYKEKEIKSQQSNKKISFT